MNYLLILLGLGIILIIIFIKFYVKKIIHEGYVNNRINKRIYENKLKLNGWSKKKIHKREKQLEKKSIEENKTPEEKNIKKIINDPIGFLKNL